MPPKPLVRVAKSAIGICHRPKYRPLGEVVGLKYALEEDAADPYHVSILWAPASIPPFSSYLNNRSVYGILGRVDLTISARCLSQNSLGRD